MTDIDDRVAEEIEAVQAILMDEVVVKNNPSGIPEVIEVVVVPATADNTDQQYVRVTLEVNITAGYPDTAPELSLRNPRGLDDDQLNTILEQAKAKCASTLGNPVIYDLIELVREHLTSSNLPSCACTICLYGFSEGDEFIKTPCYHYYHAHCLAEHASKTEAFFKEEQEKLPLYQRTKIFEVQCPVCREPITCDVETLSKAPLPLAVQNAEVMKPDAKLRELQEYMNALYLHQKEQGGIIDPDAPESKVLLVNEPFYVSKSWSSQPSSMTGTSGGLSEGSGGGCIGPPLFDSVLPEPEQPQVPRWKQRQLEQQERQRQRALQQRGGRAPQQPKPPKPTKSTNPENEEGGEEEQVTGRQRRGRGRGYERNRRNR